MSKRAPKLALVMPDADPMTADERHSRPLVVSGVLTFCLTVWAIVIFAVAHYV
jgi:hypothetical protein